MEHGLLIIGIIVGLILVFYLLSNDNDQHRRFPPPYGHSSGYQHGPYGIYPPPFPPYPMHYPYPPPYSPYPQDMQHMPYGQDPFREEREQRIAGRVMVGISLIGAIFLLKYNAEQNQSRTTKYPEPAPPKHREKPPRENVSPRPSNSYNQERSLTPRALKTSDPTPSFAPACDTIPMLVLGHYTEKRVAGELPESLNARGLKWIKLGEERMLLGSMHPNEAAARTELRFWEKNKKLWEHLPVRPRVEKVIFPKK